MFSYSSMILKLTRAAGAPGHLIFVISHLWKTKPLTLNKINTRFNSYEFFPSSQIIRGMFLLTKLTTKNSKCSVKLVPFLHFLLFINFLKKYFCMIKRMLMHTFVSLSISNFFSILAFPFLNLRSKSPHQSVPGVKMQ